MIPKGLAWICGDKKETSPETFVSKNPSSLKDELGVFGCATKEQVTAACRHGQKALAQWKKTPPLFAPA